MSEIRRCPACAMPTPDGDRMCSSCGADLSQPDRAPIAMPASAESATPLPKPPLPAPTDEASSVDAAAKTAGAIWDKAKQAIGLTTEQLPTEASTAARDQAGDDHTRAPQNQTSPAIPPVSDCKELRVEYNFSRVFMDGLHVPFQFRITPQESHLTNLFIEIRRNGNPVAREEPDEMLFAHRRLDIHMAYRPPPGLQGIISFEIYIGYDSRKTRQVFKARPTHTIFRGFEKVSAVISSLKIEINNNLKAEGAADNVIKQHMDGLEALRPKEDNPVTELAAIDIPACWNNLNLHLCKRNDLEEDDSDGIPAQPANAHFPYLTLRCGAQIVQLLSGDDIQIGKNRKCPIVARSGSSRKEKERDAAISRYHCRIERRGGRSSVVDLGYYPDQGTDKPSAYGTYLDGQRVQPGGSSPLPKDRAFTLTLAGSDQEPDAYVFEGYQQTRDKARHTPFKQLKHKADHQALSLVLRSRHVPVTHVILWEAVACRDLQWSDTDAWICRMQDGFLLVDGKQKEWLTHGKTLYIGGQIVDVGPHNSWSDPPNS